MNNQYNEGYKKALEDFSKEVIKKIENEIAEERFCMQRDKYEEQELEHINQIEMANKCLKFVKKVKEDLDVEK